MCLVVLGRAFICTAIRKIDDIVTQPVLLHQRRQIGEIFEASIDCFAVLVLSREPVGVETVGHFSLIVDYDDVEDPFAVLLVQKTLTGNGDHVFHIFAGRYAVDAENESCL